MLNVLIVEPHDIARVGLRQILKDSRLARQIEYRIIHRSQAEPEDLSTSALGWHRPRLGAYY